MKVPILFINFNRPFCTQKSFAQIRKYKPTRLYLAADGPRSGVLTDKDDVSAVRALLSGVDWDCQVHRLFFTKNMGCKLAVQKALSWFFKNEEMGVILEDDCVPSLSFFRYAAQLLEKYQFDDRVAAIHGSSLGYAPNKTESRNSYFFTQFLNMWGWATWRRTHQLIDGSMSLWLAFDNKNRFLERIMKFYGTPQDPKWIDYWCLQFSKTAFGSIDTWDYQWIFNVLEKGMYSIVPTVNMVENIGWGPGATHTREENLLLMKNKRREMPFPVKHPDTPKIHVSPQYEAYIKEAWCDLTRFHSIFCAKDPAAQSGLDVHFAGGAP